MKPSPSKGSPGLILVFLVLLAVLLMTLGALFFVRYGLKEFSGLMRRGGKPSATALPPAGPAAPEALLADGWSQRHLYKLLVSEQVSDRNFAVLDAIAERLRKGEREAGGTWLLPQFYEGLVGGMDGDVEKRRELLEEWHREFPQSQTAVIALGHWWIDYAWKARGGSWGYKVTKEGWEKFGERLDEARRVLYTLKSADVTCPEWYSALLTVALGESWDNFGYAQVYDEAVRRWPDYYTFYFIKSHRLLPRWHGSSGDWEAYAKQAVKGRPDADALYARIVWSKAEYHDNIFKDSRAEWAMAKRGLETILAQYPASSWNLAHACRLAYDAEDYEALGRWGRGLDGITVASGPLTPGMLAFGRQVAADPARKLPSEGWSWEPDRSECRAVIFLKDDLVAVGTRDGGVYLCETKLMAQPKKILQFDGPVSKFALSPDRRLLAIAQGSLSNSKTQAGSAMVYDWQEQKEVAEIDGWRGTVTEVAFSHDGNTLFLVGGVVTEAAEWKAWDRKTGETRTLDWAKDRGNALVSVDTHPSQPLVAVDWGNSVRVWNYETGEQVFASAPAIQPGNLYYAGQSYISQVWSVRFSPDGSQLLAGACPSVIERSSTLGGITAWDVAAGFAPKTPVAADKVTGVDKLRFSADGRFMLSNDQKAMMVLRDGVTREVTTIYPAEQEYVLDLAFSPNGKLAATAGRENSVKVWKLP